MIDANELYRSPTDFKPVKLTKNQQDACDRICKLAGLFFSSSRIPDFKVNGFLLWGKPQTGKTEVAKQVCRKLWTDDRNLVVAFLDPSSVLYAELGISEKLIDQIFHPSRLSDKRKVIFFDDIDCLFFGRENAASQTWHISMSSVMFHSLDNVDPRNTLFIATSNKKELLDFAMQTRLMQIELKLPSKEELEKRAEKMLKGFNLIGNEEKESILTKVKNDIVENETGFRDIQYNIARYMAGA